MTVKIENFTAIVNEAALRHAPASGWYMDAMHHLVDVVQQLSHARTYEEITAIAGRAARELTGADGATFVLREGDECHYAEENAIAPLWKGKRFPMDMCISGWVMKTGKNVMIEDVFQDPRIPVVAYKPTFVKSLAMVPIRKNAPVAAIGNYWKSNHVATEEEMTILQALADTTSVAMENAQLYAELQQKIQALQESNYELSRFAWVASHDLREPLRTIATQIEMLEFRHAEALDDKAKAHIHTALGAAERMQKLIHDILVHSEVEKAERHTSVSLDEVMEAACADLDASIHETGAEIRYHGLPEALGNFTMLERLFQNLLSNAIKFQNKDTKPIIQVASKAEEGQWHLTFRDNGIGISPEYCKQIFGMFQRLNTQDKYLGSGIGLATCKKIAERHGGRIWAESTPGKGSVFHLILPMPKSKPEEQ